MEIRDDGPAASTADAEEALEQRAPAILPALGSHDYNWQYQSGQDIQQDEYFAQERGHDSHYAI